MSNIKYAKYGKIVTVSYSQSYTPTAGSWQTIGTLPSGYRPKYEMYTSPDFGNSDNWLRITTGGVIQFYTNTTVTSEVLRFSMSFIVA